MKDFQNITNLNIPITDNNAKPKRKKRKLWLIISIIVILIPLLLIGSILIYFETQIKKNPINKDKAELLTFMVNAGDSASDISTNLSNQNITTNKYLFSYYIRTRNLSNQLKAGEYEFNPAQISLIGIADLITHGEIADNKVRVTIPEGYTSKQIDKKLAETDLENFNVGDLLKLTNYKGEEGQNRTPEQQALYEKFKTKYSFLQDQPETQYEGLEGYLFPDTYIYEKDESFEEIVDKMLKNFDKKLTQELRDKIKDQNKTIHETITMASIVQRESGKSLETDQKIAGIFYNRIKDGIALGSCSTLQYITETNKFQYTNEETEIESPYNTYQNPGLPVGPIANPGIISIKASIDPEIHDYYYFLNTEDGDFVWSKTFEEHVNAKNKYLN